MAGQNENNTVDLCDSSEDEAPPRRRPPPPVAAQEVVNTLQGRKKKKKIVMLGEQPDDVPSLPTTSTPATVSKKNMPPTFSSSSSSTSQKKVGEERKEVYEIKDSPPSLPAAVSTIRRKKAPRKTVSRIARPPSHQPRLLDETSTARTVSSTSGVGEDNVDRKQPPRQQPQSSLLSNKAASAANSRSNSLDLTVLDDEEETKPKSLSSSSTTTVMIASKNNSKNETASSSSLTNDGNNIMTTSTSSSLVATSCHTNDKTEEEEKEPSSSTFFFERHCWKCHVELRHPESSSSNNNNVIKSCYALHEHPVFHIPVCSVCIEDIVSSTMMMEQQPNDTTYCSLCARHEDDVDNLFLCDTRGCQRAVCDVCVQQAYPHRPGMVKELLDGSDPWKCCHCVPPRFLGKLQHHLKELHETNANETKEELLDVLFVTEGKKRECEIELDNEDETKDEIYNEAMKRSDLGSLNDRDKFARLEFNQWKVLQQHHLHRLEDMISNIQEDLEKQGFDVYDLPQYVDELVKPAAAAGAAGGDDNVEEEPDWKLSADQELGKKMEAKKKLLAKLEIKEKYKRDCAERLAKSEEKRQEILRRLQEKLNLPYLSPEVNERARREFEKWRSDEQRKHTKLTDDLKFMYANLEETGITPTEEKNLRSAKKAPTFDEDSEVEDLGSLDSDDNHRSMEELERRLDNGWISNGIASQEEIKVALANEDSRTTKNKREIFGITDADDRKEVVVEDHRRSGAIVRSDYRFLLQMKEQEKASKLNKTIRRRRRVKENYEKRKSENASAEIISTSEDDDIDIPIGNNDLFEGSSFVLSDATHESYPITVASCIAKKLKQHQKDGIEFMFRNSFSDLMYRDAEKASKVRGQVVGGCVLAHNMGLGKSLASVALVHTLLRHPSFKMSAEITSINTVLLLVPTVTVKNWEDEFEKWVGHLHPKVDVFTLDEKSSRKSIVQRWHRRGGVLLMSIQLFLNQSKDSSFEKYLQNPGPDVILLDEAHQMLKNKSKTFAALNLVQTKRRICLTGSPFQNNLFEYFRMLSYVRPGVLGNSEREFEKEYVNRILEGNASDASEYQKHVADELLARIQDIVKPHIHRVDRTALLRDLPPMQQVVLHFRPTKVQSMLYSAFKKHQKKGEGAWNNFLKVYHELRPIHNHPGCLSRKSDKALRRRSSNGINPEASALSSAAAEETKPKPSDISNPTKSNKTKPGFLPTLSAGDIIDLISDDEDDDTVASKDSSSDDRPWWENRKNKEGNLDDVINGNKIVMLLHILVHSAQIDEKVVVFSQCLKTLDFLKDIFALPNWRKHVPSLAEAFPNSREGGWKHGKDFLRIDGTKTSAERGEMVKEFNDDLSQIKCFLISPRAGGVGINLCAANRVVLLDSNFNPSTDEQALYRCYRYGQKQNVFVYRFLVEGTMEEKVYSRAVSKSGLALRLLDGKNINRIFSRQEMEDFTKVFDWVQCDECEKWRVLPPEADIDVEQLPDLWYCHMMNEHDKRMDLQCSFPEKDQAWYNMHFSKPNVAPDLQVPSEATDTLNCVNLGDMEQQEKLTDRDEILKGLLDVKGIVSRHYFHDALLSEKELENPRAHTAAAAAKSPDQDIIETVASKSPSGHQQVACQFKTSTPARLDEKSIGGGTFNLGTDGTVSCLLERANESILAVSSEGSLAVTKNGGSRSTLHDDDNDDDGDVVGTEGNDDSKEGKAVPSLSSSKSAASANAKKTGESYPPTLSPSRRKSHNHEHNLDDREHHSTTSTPERFTMRKQSKKQKTSLTGSPKKGQTLLRRSITSSSSSPAIAAAGTPDTVATSNSTSTERATNLKQKRRGRELWPKQGLVDDGDNHDEEAKKPKATAAAEMSAKSFPSSPHFSGLSRRKRLSGGSKGRSESTPLSPSAKKRKQSGLLSRFFGKI